MPTYALDIKDDNRQDDHRSSILIIGGAGGVGSIAIQLAKNLVNLSSFSSLSSSSSIASPSSFQLHLLKNSKKTKTNPVIAMARHFHKNS
jgi:D-arabinose 1-dehydrogenase-like Zn-dependent alcohol dehydrogenase